jgi:hypothetical protein
MNEAKAWLSSVSSIFSSKSGIRQKNATTSQKIIKKDIFPLDRALETCYN